MAAGGAGPGGPRRRGPRPRHTRDEVVAVAVAIADERGLAAVTIRSVAARLGAGTMSLYSYVPDKQSLIYAMVEHINAELAPPPAPTGDWRADMHWLAGEQRAQVQRHPWLREALSHRMPLGPAALAYLEYALGALAPLDLDAGTALETIALLNGFVLDLTLAGLEDQRNPPEPAEAAAAGARLAELMATGRYPRFAAILAGSGGQLDGIDLTEHFYRLYDRILNGLLAPAAQAPPPPAPNRERRNGHPG